MSLDRLVECVPNISEGQDRTVIDAVVAAFDSVTGAQVLDVDPGAATNRTVITLVGTPEAASEAAFRGIREAQRLIDMSQHQGEHPRMGAVDVCPFVPVRGVTMDDCVALAHALGRRVGEELSVPVYFYEFAATSEERRNLAHVRAGEYEGLEAKLADPRWAPDAGPARFDPRYGATAISARKFLIAYNVNLNAREKRLATEIAFEIREQGRNLRGPDGKFIRDENGVPKKRPGRYPNLKAVGWVIEEYGRAQVSMNLTDYEKTGIHTAFDACEEEARKLGARVTGSELVGLVPLEALLRAGRHYLERQGGCRGVSERRLVEIAVQSMGLAELSPFDPEERVIEYRLRDAGARRLVSLSVADFAEELGSESPAPGGGSVAALCGTLSASLSAMVGHLTVGKRKHRESWERANEIAAAAKAAEQRLLAAIDADTEAFNLMMEARRLPADTEEQERAKVEAVAEAEWHAVEVPASVLRECEGLVSAAASMLEVGNPNAASDAATAVSCAVACAQGSFYNVLINLEGLEDAERRSAARAEAEAVLARVEEAAARVSAAFRARF